MATFEITFNNQRVIGTDSSDFIAAVGFAGNPGQGTTGQDDTVFADGGADTVNAGDGHDRVFGGSGNDVLRGNGTISSVDGNDLLFGGTGSDQLFGDQGNDTLGVEVGFTNFGADSFSGGSGFDRLVFQTANIIEVNGSPSSFAIQDATRGVSVNLINQVRPGVVGDFILTGDASGEDVFAFVTQERGRIFDANNAAFADIEEFQLTNFADFILDTSAGHIIRGGGGDDFISGGGGADLIDGGVGTDTALYRFSPAGVSISLLDLGSGGSGSGGEAANDKLIGIENVHGSDFNDFVLGDQNANVLRGFAGNDTLIGGAGTDTISGGDGNDTVRGGLGNDSVAGGAGTDTALLQDWNGFSAPVGTSLHGTITLTDSGLGEAVLTQSSLLAFPARSTLERDTITGVENVTASDVSETITGNSAANVIDGRGGSDLIIGGLGDDTLIGGDGLDTADYSLSAPRVVVNLATGIASGALIGNDTLSQIENVRGGAGDDALTGSVGANRIDGGAGADTMTGGGGADVFDFNNVSDFVLGATSDLILDFSTVEDTIDLLNVDANSTTAGNQAFTFIGGADFTGTAGQLRAFTLDSLSVPLTFIEADTDGNGLGDIQIILQERLVLTANDFIL